MRRSDRERFAFGKRRKRFIHGRNGHAHRVVGSGDGAGVTAVIEVGQQYGEMIIRPVPEKFTV